MYVYVCRAIVFTATVFVAESQAPWRRIDWYAHLTTPSIQFTNTHSHTYSGQLTVTGVDDAKRLGAQLRRIYIDELGLVSGALDSANVFVRSTNLKR